MDWELKLAELERQVGSLGSAEDEVAGLAREGEAAKLKAKKKAKGKK